MASDHRPVSPAMALGSPGSESVCGFYPCALEHSTRHRPRQCPAAGECPAAGRNFPSIFGGWSERRIHPAPPAAQWGVLGHRAILSTSKVSKLARSLHRAGAIPTTEQKSPRLGSPHDAGPTCLSLCAQRHREPMCQPDCATHIQNVPERRLWRSGMAVGCSSFLADFLGICGFCRASTQRHWHCLEL